MDSRKSNNPLKRWGSELNKEFSPEEYRKAEKHLKKMFNVLNHQGNANQNNPEIPSHQSEWLRSKIQVTADAGEDMEKAVYSPIVSGIASWYNCSGNRCVGSSENWT